MWSALQSLENPRLLIKNVFTINRHPPHIFTPFLYFKGISMHRQGFEVTLHLMNQSLVFFLLTEMAFKKIYHWCHFSVRWAEKSQMAKVSWGLFQGVLFVLLSFYLTLAIEVAVVRYTRSRRLLWKILEWSLWEMPRWPLWKILEWSLWMIPGQSLWEILRWPGHCDKYYSSNGEKY